METGMMTAASACDFGDLRKSGERGPGSDMERASFDGSGVAVEGFFASAVAEAACDGCSVVVVVVAGGVGDAAVVGVGVALKGEVELTVGVGFEEDVGTVA